MPFADTNLFKIPDGLDDEQILFLTDILPTGYMGVELAEVGPGDTVVVIGCGPVGVFAQLSALIWGAATVIAVDLDVGRLEKASALGCRPLNPSREDVTEIAKSLSGGKGADCTIEAVGNPVTVKLALDVVRPGGRVAVIGVVAGEQVSIDPTEIITHRMSLSEGARGYEVFDNHEEDVLKVVMTP